MPLGFMREAQIEEKVALSGRMVSPSELAHLGTVSRGNCSLSVDGIPDAIPLTGCDCFLLAPRTSFILRNTLLTRPRNFGEVVPKTSSNVVHYGEGGAPTTIIPGFAEFRPRESEAHDSLVAELILINGQRLSPIEEPKTRETAAPPRHSLPFAALPKSFIFAFLSFVQQVLFLSCCPNTSRLLEPFI